MKKLFKLIIIIFLLAVLINLYVILTTKKNIVNMDNIKEDDYDEVNVMKNYLIENGIPSEDIFMDHLGISTYDSILRTKLIYKANKILVVTQEYHLYRALYISKNINLKVYGISASERDYAGQFKRDIREYAARIKDFVKCLLNSNPTYLGEVINIKGNGNKTND